MTNLVDRGEQISKPVSGKLTILQCVFALFSN